MIIKHFHILVLLLRELNWFPTRASILAEQNAGWLMNTLLVLWNPPEVLIEFNWTWPLSKNFRWESHTQWISKRSEFNWMIRETMHRAWDGFCHVENSTILSWARMMSDPPMTLKWIVLIIWGFIKGFLSILWNKFHSGYLHLEMSSKLLIYSTIKGFLFSQWSF